MRWLPLIAAIAYVVVAHLVEDHKRREVVYECIDSTMIEQMHDGTCKMYLRMYGFDAVVELASGECLVAMWETKRTLHTRVLGTQGEGL